MSDGGSIAKLVPLSYLGPHGCSITALSRRHCGLASLLSKARQGNSTMQSFSFASSDLAERGKKKQKAGRRKSAAAATTAGAAKRGKLTAAGNPRQLQSQQLW